MEQVHIQVEELYKTYDDGTEALKPVNLKIYENEVLVLLGPSGCGKSTLLRMIAGLEKPSGGKIFFHGEDVTRLDPEKRNIGFVFQQYALFPTMTVAENIAFGMKLRKKSKLEREKKVDELLELMNITDLRDRKPAQLSGGQQQRVAIARALAIEPKILLMDEPLTALDAKLKEHLRIELAQLFRKLKITTVYVTHDQVEAMAIATRIAVMNKGVIEQIGLPKDIYHRPKSPFVAQFVGQINRISGKIVKEGQNNVVDFSFYKAKAPQNLHSSKNIIEAFIRPEDISIAQGETGDFTAKVQEVIFLGQRVRMIAEVGEQKLLVDLPNDVSVEHGEHVNLKIDNKKIIYA